MGSCLQSLEEPCEHSAWEPGRKSQGSSQLPMVVLKPKTATLHGKSHGFSRVAAGTLDIFSSYDGDAHSKREFV